MIRIVCVGNLKEKYLQDAASEYIKRIKKFEKIEIIECKEINNYSTIKQGLDEEAKEIQKYLKGYIIKLDIRGKMLNSEEFSSFIEKIKIEGSSDITFVIGSSNGISDNIKSNFDFSFSLMTFPHQIARIMLLEQIYRAYTILNHTPYHK